MLRTMRRETVKSDSDRAITVTRRVRVTQSERDTITVKSDSGRLRLKVSPATTIRELKAALERRVGVDPKTCELTHNRRRLNNVNSLEEYGIAPGALLGCTAPKGGHYHKSPRRPRHRPL